MARVTLKDIAEAAQVSVSTVSLHVRGLPGVSLATQRRIAAAIDKLGYAPRPPNQGTPRRLIGVAVERLPFPILNDLFYAEVMSGIQSYATACGFSVILAIVEGQDLVQVLGAHQAEGWLILGGGSITDSQVMAVQRQGIPFVLVDNYVRDEALCCVMPDNLRGGYAAMAHLLDLGHRQIAVLCGPEKYKTLGDRLAGAQMAAFRGGLDPAGLIVQPALSSGEPQKGYREMWAVLEKDTLPTAVFAVSDKTAMGAMQALQEAGLRVPQDVSIVGFDDLAGSAAIGPGLTTVAIDKRGLGVAAVRSLLDRLEDPALPLTQTLVHAQLVIRGTTAAYHESGEQWLRTALSNTSV